ncbi:uncharacterized protein [Prorops nasuta]|uniref:uncharacterized protein n=1 Tax=Prorops nasuta TaxID=863751 RepID=UPI0034CDEA68
MISLKSICIWAGTNPSQRNFVEGERIYQSGHIIKCGTNERSENDATISFTALCLQTSNLRGNPHEINGIVSNTGDILNCVCSCKAGAGKKCKHIIGSLLYCYQKGNSLETLSCTDKKCEWKKVHKTALENYSPAPLMNHSCYAQPVKRKKIINSESIKICQKEVIELEEELEIEGSQSSTNFSNSTKTQKSIEIIVTESQLDEIKNLICSRLPSSALAKHVAGRHDPFIPKHKSKTTEVEKETIKFILQNEDNELMQKIRNFEINEVETCCFTTLEQLSANLQEVCEKTKNTYTHWMRERSYRITGSICYELYTYTKTKRNDDEWLRKIDNTFVPKSFKSDVLDYGKGTEKEARNAFRKIFNCEVVEIGLVVSKTNPWLAYSPDGIIIKNKMPIALLEIKCPIKGKTTDIYTTVESQIKKCLFRDGENLMMKKKHQYYGQIQLGMAVLNLNVTYFVIYSSFDKGMCYLKIMRDNIFIITMLFALKKVYFKYKLHAVCLQKRNCIEHRANKPVEVV